MKRNVIIAVAAAAAVVGGGTLAGAALGSDDETTGQGGRTGESSSAIAPAANDMVVGGDASDDADDADDANDPDDADDADDAREQNDGDDDGSQAPGAGAAFEQATETARTAVPGVVTDVEFDGNDDGGRAAWEIGLWGEDAQWHRVWVSADGTEVLDSRASATDDDDQDDRDDQDAAARLLNDDGVPIAEAIRLAEDHTSAAFREADLDDGRWHVELRGDDGTEYELEIDLTSGEIAGEEQDSDQVDNADDADDADADADGHDAHDDHDDHDGDDD
ncbi:PepSY domain-containing protein [Streptomyces sp. 6N223]|uniref:PepSY domain-containing protein n=1 Tax=Streptomyces sp. 6N223 TaxID=3457412 RepID=UPI003FCFD048